MLNERLQIEIGSHWQPIVGVLWQAKGDFDVIASQFLSDFALVNILFSLLSF